MQLTEHLYRMDRGLYHPQDAAKTPWGTLHQGGVPMAALVAHLVEVSPAAEPMLLTRLTIDILRQAPMTPFAATTRVLRDGRRLQNLEVVLAVDDAPFLRASAVRMRLAESPASQAAETNPTTPEDFPIRPARPDGHRSSLQQRFVRSERGAGCAWVRPAVALTPAIPISPVSAAAMAADFGSAAAPMLNSAVWTFANVDVSIHFMRAPASDWILVDSRTRSAGNGIALVDTALADLHGAFARAQQTLFVARRSGGDS